jgi:hypothetical protein
VTGPYETLTSDDVRRSEALINSRLLKLVPPVGPIQLVVNHALVRRVTATAETVDTLLPEGETEFGRLNRQICRAAAKLLTSELSDSLTFKELSVRVLDGEQLTMFILLEGPTPPPGSNSKSGKVWVIR